MCRNGTASGSGLKQIHKATVSTEWYKARRFKWNEWGKVIFQVQSKLGVICRELLFVIELFQWNGVIKCVFGVVGVFFQD